MRVPALLVVVAVVACRHPGQSSRSHDTAAGCPHEKNHVSRTGGGNVISHVHTHEARETSHHKHHDSHHNHQDHEHHVRPLSSPLLQWLMAVVIQPIWNSSRAIILPFLSVVPDGFVGEVRLRGEATVLGFPGAGRVVELGGALAGIVGEASLGEALSASMITSLLPAMVVLLFPSSTQRGMGRRSVNWKFLVYQCMMALGAGGLVGDVVFHTIPTLVGRSLAQQKTSTISGQREGERSAVPATLATAFHAELAGLTPLHAFIVGIALFYFIDSALHKFHSHGDGDHHHHRHVGNQESRPSKTSQVAVSSSVLLGVIGDLLHNFCDGVVIGSSFMVASSSPMRTADEGAGGQAHAPVVAMGWRTTLLVMFHEVPHECGDFAFLLQSGWSRLGALGIQVLTGLGSLAGVLSVFLLSPSAEFLQGVLVPIASGSFFYLAIATMLAELKKNHSSLLRGGDAGVMRAAIAGIVLMAGELLSFLLGAQIMWWILLAEEAWGEGGAAHIH